VSPTTPVNAAEEQQAQAAAAAAAAAEHASTEPDSRQQARHWWKRASVLQSNGLYDDLVGWLAETAVPGAQARWAP
jgi:hypothetical protein